MILAAVTSASPVYPEYFADPFVFRYDHQYYAIGTGAAEASGQISERVFPLLISEDLVRWKGMARALIRPDPSLGNSFWAPEIVCHEGKFYLYYSVGQEDKNHHLRVAISNDPLGPYHDIKALTELNSCPFAIDPHPFQDRGEWYLFYARDFLDTCDPFRAGTALIVDRLKTMTQLAGEEIVVMRSQYDWQRFQSNRLMYGKIWDWHTMEGPCVRKYEGRYYCFYSGGRWETETYGVDYGIADNVTGPYLQKGNEKGPRVLRTIPGRLIGPGHNSIVTGPDGNTEYIVYHAWNREMTKRQMHVSRLIWTSDGPRVANDSQVRPTNRRD